MSDLQQELGDAAAEIEFLLPALGGEHYRIVQVLEQALRAIKRAQAAAALRDDRANQ